ncbi:LiaF transmembrane domain-containing protein [Pediococcus pentosaceus]|uniref:LiaF transmembrane domain-containing protein n=1 Tax=Pediococcus pentosaceus TaxID=1255 RepID=UPI001303E016|nr:hypothetical protein [Pediococcus pentosaceus]MCQ9196927.1 hypothetical protein [Pediococcus pentosaceus]MDD1388492.1 hypothetical protein [Pediococcus pentosaceus]QGZ69423.1 hypothetical protein GQS62_00635 [Pediococcus pentosaceus]
MKKSQWFWGTLFVLAAAVLVATQMGWTAFTLNPFSVVASVFLIAALVVNLVHLSIAGTIFSIAFLLMLYGKPLGISSLVPWTILLAAVLLTIGLSLIFHPYRRNWQKHALWKNFQHGFNHHPDYDYTESTQSADDDVINIETSMGSGIHYIQSQDLKSININNYMGTTKVYFDQAHPEDFATANINCQLGNITLYLPHDWNIVTDINSVMSGIDERGIRNSGTGPTLYIKGKLYLSGVTLHYV